MNQLPPIHGVSPVLEVPFHPDGAVDERGFLIVVERVMATGVSSLMFPGFASEYHKLSDAERSHLTRLLLTRTQNHPDLTAIVSVPDQATVLAAARARALADQGADAINLLPPHFLEPSDHAVHDHLATVLDAVAPLPAILQYAPAQTGSSLATDTITSLARHHPNLVLVKVESQPPTRLIASLTTGDPPLPSIIGYAGVQMINALEVGAVGVQPGCSFIEIYQQIWRLWSSGEQPAARALHTRLMPYIGTWMQAVEFIIAAEKVISQRRGWFASDHCRAPGWALDATELALIKQFLCEFDDILTINAAR